MDSIRDISIEVIKNLPNSSSMEDIMYKLNMTAQALEGLNDKVEGKVKSTQELLDDVTQWNSSQK